MRIHPDSSILGVEISIWYYLFKKLKGEGFEFDLFQNNFSISSLVEIIHTFCSRNFASECSLGKFSCVSTGIKTFWKVLLIMAKQFCLSVGKWLYGCILIQRIMQCKYYYRAFHINMGESYKHNHHEKKEREKEKASCRSIHTVWNYLALVLQTWRDYDICCLEIHTNGVKV